MQGLKDAPGCERALPFVLQFYGRPSTCLWEDDCAVVHEITQGEGCTLWVNTGSTLLCKQLCSPRNFLRSCDIWVVANPHHIAAIYAELESALWNHAGIRINLGKMQLFNRGGFLPSACQQIFQAGREMTPITSVARRTFERERETSTIQFQVERRTTYCERQQSRGIAS